MTPRAAGAARRRHAGLAVLVAAFLALVAPAGPAPAQEPRAVRPRLVSQTPWVAEDQPFNLAFRVAGGLPADGTVELTLYGAVTDREALVRGAAEPDLLGPVRDTLSVPTALLPEGADGAFRLRLATDGLTAGIQVDDPGVYPLSLVVVGPDGEPGRPMLTFVVRTGEAVAQSRVPTALVLPLHGAPSFGPDGVAALSDRTRRLLQVRSELLEHHDDIDLTVVPTPETIEALSRTDPDLLATVRAALRGRHVVAGPYVRVDLAAFAAVSSLGAPLEDQFRVGERTLRQILRQPVDARTWAGSGNPTTAALDALAGAGVDRAVFREESVSGTGVRVDRPVLVRGATGQGTDAVLVDSVLRGHVLGTADPVLSAHRALADLALLATPADDGGLAPEGSGRGLVVELPATRALPAAFLDALLRGLGGPGPLEPVSVAGLFDEVETAARTEVEGVALAGQDLSAFGGRLSTTRLTAAGYAAFAGRADPLGIDMRRRLLVAGSADLTENQRGAYLRTVTADIEARTAAVSITDDETVTLTSREGDIPITIRNDTGAPVEVEVVFDSDNRLAFPDGATRRLTLADGANHIEVPVVARASGSFPLRITARSPDGVLTVSRARVTVRSTAFSGVGLVLSVGALLVLVVWWARHWHTARRNRRLVDPEDLPVDTDPHQARNPDDRPPV